MTNGEKLDQVFPDGICPFSKNWLDYEYKEPTTKNNLAVDCIVDVLGSYTDLDIPYKREIAENILAKLSSVTPQLSSGTRKNSKKLENASPIIDWNNCHTSEQLDSIATTKDDLAVDKAKKDSELIARGDVINMIKEIAEYHTGDSFNADRLIRNIKELPPSNTTRAKKRRMA